MPLTSDRERHEEMQNNPSDVSGAKQKNFLGFKLSETVAVFIIMFLISIFGALVIYFFAG